jgi:hypothetical protein
MDSKSPANARITVRSLRGRYLGGRSITAYLWPIIYDSTDHTKILQIATFTRTRSMRSVPCAVL